MLSLSKKMLLVCAILLMLSQNSFSMEILKTGAQQIFNRETVKIAGAGIASVLGYNLITALTTRHIVESKEYAEDLHFNDSTLDKLLFVNNILQALSIGSFTALAARLGPKTWPQLNLCQLALPSVALGLGIGLTRYSVNYYNEENDQDDESSFAQTLITAKSCMNAIEIVFPLSILCYRYMQ